MSSPNGSGTANASVVAVPPQLTCGIIMPISALDGCSAEHWSEVKDIIIEAVQSIREQQFITRMVSDADDVGVIQKRIIQNVYNSTIVICDVSGKNSNVMFELGLRLAFDKATVIVKDDKTGYSFDTGVIEHLDYPRDLRFGKIVEFKRKLADKVRSTYKASVDDPTHSPFLKSFGQFQVASLNQTEASPDKVILEVVLDLQREMQLLRRRNLDERRRSKVTTSQDVINRYIVDAVAAKLAPDGDPGLVLTDEFLRSLAREVLDRYGAIYAPELLRDVVNLGLYEWSERTTIAAPTTS